MKSSNGWRCKRLERCDRVSGMVVGKAQSEKQKRENHARPALLQNHLTLGSFPSWLYSRNLLQPLLAGPRSRISDWTSLFPLVGVKSAARRLVHVTCITFWSSANVIRPFAALLYFIILECPLWLWWLLQSLHIRTKSQTRGSVGGTLSGVCIGIGFLQIWQTGL